MSVFTKRPKYVVFLGVQADEVLVKATKNVAEAVGIEADLSVLSVVTDIAEGVVKAPADIQGRYLERQAKAGKRRPEKDEDPASDSAIDPKMVAFGEMSAEQQDQYTVVFNMIRGELAAAGRL